MSTKGRGWKFVRGVYLGAFANIKSPLKHDRFIRNWQLNVS